MEKLAIGADLPKNLLDIDNGVEKILSYLQKQKIKKFLIKCLCS